MDKHKKYIAAQAKIFKALGHPSRLLMVDALRLGEKCVCDLKTLVDADMSTISKHLSILKEAGIVVAEKRGANIYYRLVICCLDTFLACTGEMVQKRIASQLDILDQQ